MWLRLKKAYVENKTILVNMDEIQAVWRTAEDDATTLKYAGESGHLHVLESFEEIEEAIREIETARSKK